jgi:hypothetical protein
MGTVLGIIIGLIIWVGLLWLVGQILSRNKPSDNGE